MDINLGAIPLSADILTQANIGLWAFELDEGAEPRMYVDEAMLKLLGLKKQLPPEQTYHAWYDNIDPAHYDEVHASVEKMREGIHSEVQYPWLSPDGKIMIVRCGGVRNYNYKKGIRIEGVHRDVTDLVHFEKQKEEELKRKSIQLEFEKLRVDALTFLAEYEPEPIEFINFFADRFLTLSGCDQVIYRSVSGSIISRNGPGVKICPASVCKKCPYSDPTNPVYLNESVELEDLHNAEVLPPKECPVKSTYITLVKFNGSIHGTLSLQYINKSCSISESGRETLNMFSQMLSLALSNINARKARQQYINERYANATKIIDSFCKQYTDVFFVDTIDDSYRRLTQETELSKRYTGQGKNFSKAFHNYIQGEVIEQDRKLVLEYTNYGSILKKLKDNNSFDVEYRARVNGIIKWHKITFSSIVSGTEILVGTVELNNEILYEHVKENILEDYYGIYIIDLDNNIVSSVKTTKSFTREIHGECYSKSFINFINGLKEEDVKFFSKLVNPQYIKKFLAHENKHVYTYFSPRRNSWIEFSLFVLSRDENGVPQSVAQFFADVDSLQKKNLELSQNLKKQIEENKEYESQIEETLSITNFFLNTYSSAYYIDLTDCSYRIYKENTLNRNKNISINHYYKELSQILKTKVRSDDKARLLEILKPEYLEEALRKNKEFSFIFNDISGETPRRIRFQAIRGADRHHAAIGFSDITAELKAEERYTNSIMSLTDNFQAIYDVDVITGKFSVYQQLSHDVTSNIVFGNDFYTDIMLIVNKKIHKDDRHLFEENFSKEKLLRLVKYNKEISFEYRILFNEKTQWFRLKVVKSPQTKNHFFLGVFSVNKARLAEKELQNVVAGLASEFTELIHVDAETGLYRNYRTNKNNKAIDKIAKPDQTFGSLVKAFATTYIYKEDCEEFLKYADMNYFKSLLAQKKSHHTYVRLKKENGYRWFEQVFVKVQEEKEELKDFIVCITDRDNEVRTEQENKRQLQEALSMAQSANRAKTTFLNNMSHDIRTPMNAIIGYTGLAESHIDNKEQVQDYLKKINESSDHLLSLINDVLDMSRIESGKMNLEEKPENLSEMIHTLRNIVQADIKARKLDLFIESSDVKDEDIICDKLRVNQVLLNILSNAIKYTPSGGTISVRIKENDISKNGYASYEFTIKDSGIGMSPEFLKTVFDPFTRMKSSTVSGIQGTGLGMAITKNIVDMMGGKIDISSTLNKGTEVVINLDFKLQSAEKIPEKISELENLKALVIDGNAYTSKTITSILSSTGMNVEYCTTGKEGISKAKLASSKGEAFKVYIIDWLMPDMDGIDTAAKIRDTIKDNNSIILLTAYDWSDSEDRAKEAGITGFISKPVFPSDLRAALNKCLGKDQPVKQEATEDEFEILNGKRVLLVDDNEYNREIAQEILEDANMIITTADDGSKALEVMKNAKAGDFDLVLMDIQMPVMNGYDAAKNIRALGTEISKIPILAMTANAFAEDRELALQSGMNDHITKPITVEVLKKTLAQYV